MFQRSLRFAIIALCGFAAASGVLALGFGQLPQSTVLGQALDLTVPLLLEPGESLTASCLSAAVHVGDQVLSASALRIGVETVGSDGRGRQLRLRSPVVVLEPVVSVSLRAGCGGSVSRHFTVFADPPAIVAVAPAPREPDSERAPPVATSTTARPPAVSAAPKPPARPAAVRSDPSAVLRRAAGDTNRTAVATRRMAEPKAARRDNVVAAARGIKPRLELEPAIGPLYTGALVAATDDAARGEAAQSLFAAQAAASAAEARAQSLDAEMTRLQVEAAAQRAATEQLRERLARAEQHRFLGDLPWLLLAALAGFTLWLSLRLRALQRRRQAGWLQAARAMGEGTRTAPSVLVDAPARAAALAAVLGVDERSAEDTATDSPEPHSVLKMTATLDDLHLTGPARVDELMDLEQQVEFFLILGDADAAIELLRAHLRATGGPSPLPYLRLLDIYRRIDQSEPYQRIRDRFQQRFGAGAPAWGDDLHSGRGLQDHPAVMTMLQTAWSSPNDALAALEGLLFGRSAGELLELPAYREALTLYAVARDLHRSGDDVDVLLPLSLPLDAQTPARPSILGSLDSPATMMPIASEDASAAIDLDLSEPHGSHAADAPVVPVPTPPRAV